MSAGGAVVDIVPLPPPLSAVCTMAPCILQQHNDSEQVAAAASSRASLPHQPACSSSCETSPAGSAGPLMDDEVHKKKRRLTLDLSAVRGGGVISSSTSTSTTTAAIRRPLLTSPDVRMLKLGSPELERFILQQSGGAGGALLTATPTPGGPYTLATVLAARPPTDAQESYARGFMDALQDLRQQEQQQQHTAVVTSGVDTSSGHQLTTLTACDTSGHVLSQPPPPPPHQYIVRRAAAVMEPPPVYTAPAGHQLLHVSSRPAPQSVKLPPDCVTTFEGADDGRRSTVAARRSAPPVSGSYQIADTGGYILPDTVQTEAAVGSSDDQYHLKLERKRMRNRIAATKCRHRKLERISQLEEQVERVRRDNTQLHALAASLRRQVDELRHEIVEHSRHGCHITIPVSAASASPCSYS